MGTFARLDWQQDMEGTAGQQALIVAGTFDPDPPAVSIDRATGNR